MRSVAFKVYTVARWTVVRWREGRGGHLDSSHTRLYCRPGNDSATTNAGSLSGRHAVILQGHSSEPSSFGIKIIVLQNGLQSSEVQCLSPGHDVDSPTKLKSQYLEQSTTLITILLHPGNKLGRHKHCDHHKNGACCSKVEIDRMARLCVHCYITRILAHERPSATSAKPSRPLRTNHAATPGGGVAFNAVEPWWSELSVRTANCSCGKPGLYKAHSQRVMPQQSALNRESDMLSVFLIQYISILARCVKHK